MTKPTYSVSCNSKHKVNGSQTGAGWDRNSSLSNRCYLFSLPGWSVDSSGFQSKYSAFLIVWGKLFDVWDPLYLLGLSKSPCSVKEEETFQVRIFVCKHLSSCSKGKQIFSWTLLSIRSQGWRLWRYGPSRLEQEQTQECEALIPCLDNNSPQNICFKKVI